MYRYMELFHFEHEASLQHQFNKIKEEYLEVHKSFFNNESNHELAQELLDLILATKNLLLKMERDDLINLSYETDVHLEKVNYYVKSNKYPVKENK
ncbi:MAG: hypothetical protein ACRC0F_04155 [Cetobacterium sp.]